MRRRRLIGLGSLGSLGGLGGLACPRAAAALAASAAAALVAGCGFQLRRPQPMPFARIALQGFEPRSPLAEELRRALREVAQVVAAPAQLVLARDLSFSETAALAKELEEAQQLREMRADIVGQVLRRLASVRLPGG